MNTAGSTMKLLLPVPLCHPFLSWNGPAQDVYPAMSSNCMNKVHAWYIEENKFTHSLRNSHAWTDKISQCCFHTYVASLTGMPCEIPLHSARHSACLLFAQLVTEMHALQQAQGGILQGLQGNPQPGNAQWGCWYDGAPLMTLSALRGATTTAMWVKELEGARYWLIMVCAWRSTK